ncbi:MAG TPA: HesA/MoeB/ThiF family protein [Parafilimonas sp.]|nr:HesA/MoeB/ThiF family protein [Parafilimonas sp.]
MNRDKKYERYERQISLKEFGIAAQQKLLQAKVLVVGAGGLGCSALQYLVAAGVGTIGIADYDVVALSNLHRQVLYSVDDVGLFKADVSAKKLRRLNDKINIISYNQRLTNKNALAIIKHFDIVIDGTDNFSTRYMINDACVLLTKPLVYAAISKFEGQVAIFNVKQNGNETAISYRDLFPTPPKDDEVLNCADAGVLGILPGIIGTMQANETIKLITGIGKPLIDAMLTYNALDNSVYEFTLSLNIEAQQWIPKDEDAFLRMDYDWLCSAEINKVFEIDIADFDKLINDSNTIIIDVREEDEQPFVDAFKHLRISAGELKNNVSLLEKDNIVVFCQSGKRSLKAALLLKEFFNDKHIYSLKGGITEWKKQHALQTDEK